ncbi:hypothetical protein GCM10010411_75580 [Actinomadura fulvescens]|uniref:Uncharacterized protein n=1 Tax=Actinomadura fulvescens TaxID=46160 RepID=A0ABN3QIF1_9ACTN
MSIRSERTSRSRALLGEIQHHPGDIQRILQKRPDPTHGHELEAEAEPHMFTTVPINERPIIVIEEEHPLQIRTRRRTRVPAVRRRLFVGQEVHRHTPQSRTDPQVTNPELPNRH